MNIVVVVVLFALMHALGTFSSSLSSGVGTSAAIGFILLAGYHVGRIFRTFGQPQLTGYILTGIVAGPAVMGVLSPRMLGDLQLVNGMAVSLIALSAGCELNLKEMRPLFRAIGMISLFAVITTAGLVAVMLYFLRSSLPQIGALPSGAFVAVVAMLGSVLVAQSPAVVVALKNELKAAGPVTSTVLGVVVVADLIVILLFALSSSFVKSSLGGEADVSSVVRLLAWELGGSLVVGAILGGMVAFYFARVRVGSELVLLTLAFVVAEVGQRVHFDPLLVALAAGAVIRNLSSSGDDVHHSIERSGYPIYVLFFAVAGAGLVFAPLQRLWFPVIAVVLVRTAGLLGGTYFGARVSGATKEVARFSGLGLLPQAGLALALASIVGKNFPEFGAEASALILSVVTVNILFPPAAYRWALLKSGEADAGDEFGFSGEATLSGISQLPPP